MEIKVTRTFDILERYKSFPREDAICGRNESGWYKFSTDEYIRLSYQVAKGLLELGISKNDKVATVTNNRPEWSIMDMGISLAGAVHVPIYPTIGEEEYKFILHHSDARLLFVGDKKLFERLNPIAANISQIMQVYTFDEVKGARNYMEVVNLGNANSEKWEAEIERVKNETLPGDLATLIYTSGTTGMPKGVMLSHENLVSNFVAHSAMHELGIEHHAVSFLPLCHVYERSINYHYQYKGIGIYYVGNLAQIMGSIKEIKPHIFTAVPRLLEKVYDGFIAKGKELTGFKKALYFWSFNLTTHFEFNKKYSPLMRVKMKIADKLIYSKWRAAMGGNVRYIVSGGAALQPRIARVLGMSKMMNLEGYGLTETSPVIAVNFPIRSEMMIGTVGPVLTGVEVKIAEDGEILCKGPNVMIGYYKSPEQTAEVIDPDGWFHTGDIGTFIDDKYLKITDRKKEIFKLSGGKYVAPQVIENKLKASVYIEQVMVIGANEKFASALVSPNFPLLHDWAAGHKIHFEKNDDLIQKPEIYDLIQKEVNEINKLLGSHEQISRFRLVNAEWSPATGELSPTLKLRRNVVSTKYKDLIDDIYSVGKA